MAQPVVVYYSIQSYFLRKKDDLNAFALKKKYGDLAEVTVDDIYDSFPIDVSHYHIRFKTTMKDPEGRVVKLWLDNQNVTRVPTYKNSIIMKLLDVTPLERHPISNKKYDVLSSHGKSTAPRVRVQGATGKTSSSRAGPIHHHHHNSDHHLSHPHASTGAGRPSSVSPHSMRHAEETKQRSSGDASRGQRHGASTHQQNPLRAEHRRASGPGASGAKVSSSATATAGGASTQNGGSSNLLGENYEGGFVKTPQGSSKSHGDPRMRPQENQNSGAGAGGDPLLIPQESTPTYVAPKMDREALKKEKEDFVAKEMADRLKEHQDAETKQEETIAAKKETHIRVGSKLDAWMTGAGAKKDIRTLLVTMHEVLWEGARWQPCGMGSLLAAGGVKKMYRKAILVVHPDRHQKDTPEVQYISERVFNALNDAFKLYTASEN